MSKAKKKVTLAECPIGLFRAESGNLCLKTEYGNNEGRIDAYIVSSGEFFWGAAPQTIASQRQQLVTPVGVRAALSPPDEERLTRRAEQAEQRAEEAEREIARLNALPERAEAVEALASVGVLFDHEGELEILAGWVTKARAERDTAIAEREALRRELEIERTPVCFSCGAKVTEPCKRPPDRDCGREHLGGSRAALERSP